MRHLWTEWGLTVVDRPAPMRGSVLALVSESVAANRIIDNVQERGTAILFDLLKKMRYNRPTSGESSILHSKIVLLVEGQDRWGRWSYFHNGHMMDSFDAERNESSLVLALVLARQLSVAPFSKRFAQAEHLYPSGRLAGLLQFRRSA